MLAEGQRRGACSVLALFSLKVQLITSLTQLAGEKHSLHGFALRICILQSPSTLDLSRSSSSTGSRPCWRVAWISGTKEQHAQGGLQSSLSRSGRRLAGTDNQLGRVGCGNAARQGDLPLSSTSGASSKAAGGRRQQEQMDERRSQTTPTPQMLAPYHLSQAGTPSVPGACRDEQMESRDRWLRSPEFRDSYLTKTCFCCHSRGFCWFVLFNNYH